MLPDQPPKPLTVQEKRDRLGELQIEKEKIIARLAVVELFKGALYESWRNAEQSQAAELISKAREFDAEIDQLDARVKRIEHEIKQIEISLSNRTEIRA